MDRGQRSPGIKDEPHLYGYTAVAQGYRHKHLVTDNFHAGRLPLLAILVLRNLVDAYNAGLPSLPANLQSVSPTPPRKVRT